MTKSPFFNSQHSMDELLKVGNDLASLVDLENIAEIVKLEPQLHVMMTMTYMTAVMREILSRSSLNSLATNTLQQQQDDPKVSEVQKPSIQEITVPKTLVEDGPIPTPACPVITEAPVVPKPVVEEEPAPKSIVGEGQKLSKPEECTQVIPDAPKLPPKDFLAQLNSTLTAGVSLKKKCEVSVDEQGPSTDGNTATNSGAATKVEFAPPALSDILEIKLKPVVTRQQSKDLENKNTHEEGKQFFQLKSSPPKQSYSKDNAEIINPLLPFGKKLKRAQSLQSDDPSFKKSPQTVDSEPHGANKDPKTDSISFTNRLKPVVSTQAGSKNHNVEKMDPKLKNVLNKQYNKAEEEGIIVEGSTATKGKINNSNQEPSLSPKTFSGDEKPTIFSKPLVPKLNNVNFVCEAKAIETPNFSKDDSSAISQSQQEIKPPKPLRAPPVPPKPNQISLEPTKYKSDATGGSAPGTTSDKSNLSSLPNKPQEPDHIQKDPSDSKDDFLSCPSSPTPRTEVSQHVPQKVSGTIQPQNPPPPPPLTPTQPTDMTFSCQSNETNEPVHNQLKTLGNPGTSKPNFLIDIAAGKFTLKPKGKTPVCRKNPESKPEDFKIDLASILNRRRTAMEEDLTDSESEPDAPGEGCDDDEWNESVKD